jgi:5-methylcytosine-specific restriction endonuclease McrA
MQVFGFQRETDEKNYLHWLQQHPTGYVLNSYRKIDCDYLPLHRATCKTISQYKNRARGNAFTGKRYIKICAESKHELLNWIKQQGGSDFSDYCAKCKPYGDFANLKDQDNFDNYLTQLENAVQHASRNSQARKERLKKAKKRPEKMLVLTTVFKRNPDVIAEVRERAKGQCERCGHQAPFYRRSDNSPFLEVHHRIPLAQGGDDSVENAIALCPNCHRQAHFG